MTRDIDMEIGGKQGSRLTGRLFSKMMDLLGEELETSNEGFKFSNELLVAILLWVDDVVTCVEGTEEQQQILERIHQFAKRHKLKWGQEKCRVMRVGRHEEEQNEWKIGEMTIQECNSYKYLGDVISSDGKNTKNLETRKDKINASTISINTIAEGEILSKIESKVLLELHEKVNLPGLLINCESWTLNKSEKDELERIEIQAIKYLFDLPIHTPTPALIFNFGTLYTNLRVEQSQMIYLHKVLCREQSHWTNQILKNLKDKNAGWYKKIVEILNKYDLETNFQTIKDTTIGEWRRKVKKGIEKANKERLYHDLYKHDKGTSTLKTKTASISQHISDQNYSRKPLPEILGCNKLETKTLIIARYGMLECGKNFKGSIKENCEECNTLDNEDHRMNYCRKYSDINFSDTDVKVDFSRIYSRDLNDIREIIPKISQVWNIKNAHGSMN